MAKSKLEFSRRLQRLPPYLFAEIDRQKAKLRKKGMTLFDISIGDPDILAPKRVVSILSQSAKIKANQRYALNAGKPVFKRTIKNWMKKRFAVTLDEKTEILPLIGTKEGLVHFPLGIVNPGEYVIIPSPGYPGYRGAAVFSGAKIHQLPLPEANRFLPDLKKIPLSVRNKTKLLYCNYPNNPTTVLAPEAFLKGLVAFCARYGIAIAYDNAYSEIYFDKKPASILQIPGAKEVAIEFHSLSKTYCMTGFRLGWACGNTKLVSALLKVKTNIDSGIFGALQDAAVHALRAESAYVRKLRRRIKKRRDVFVAGLKKKGFKKIYAQSTFYVWAKVLHPHASSIDFVQHLLRRGIVATPGVGFGAHGEGFVRFALTIDEARLKNALTLL